jgi:plastocyanin
MNALDSRFIGQTNCFAQRFSTPGTFRYRLSPIPSPVTAHQEESAAQSVIVSANSGKEQSRHMVKVRLHEGELAASPAHLKIAAGDIVVWSAEKSVKLGFRVRGMIADHMIDSASMRTESIFTHAFGLPGTYRWADANGSRLQGQVRVEMPDTSGGHEEWFTSLQAGTLVHVRGETAHPEEVEIVVGQTVVWAIEDAPGVTITDATLIGGRQEPEPPSAPGPPGATST